MLGLGVLVGVANRGQRAWGGVKGQVASWVKECSSFLEGKEELGVEKALFSVGLSVSCRSEDGAARQAARERGGSEGAASMASDDDADMARQETVEVEVDNCAGQTDMVAAADGRRAEGSSVAVGDGEGMQDAPIARTWRAEREYQILD